jgi:hypothetical protein
MDVIDLASLAVSPSLDVLPGESRFVPFANFLVTCLAEHAPAEIRAEVEGGDVTHWHLTRLESGRSEVLATTPTRFFRSILGAIGSRHMPHALYGGYRHCHLRWKNQLVQAALYLGNDRLHGLWFRGRSEACEPIATADLVYAKVARHEYDQPGFAILTLPVETDSHGLRRAMVRLKEELSLRYQAQYGEPLQYLSLGRFNQQKTTKLHLDGAPVISFLMLGYEPTTVRSEFRIADFSRCAADMDLTPAQFMETHNPMFGAGAELLKPYTTTIADWDETCPRIIIVNNSTAASVPGVLHGATILQPIEGERRIINSTMIVPRSLATRNMEAAVSEFVSTKAVAGDLAIV